MKRSKLLLSVAFAGLLLSTGCTEDPEAAANEVFVAASAKWAEYQALATDDTSVLEQRLNLLTEIDSSLQKIVSDYPSSTLAVELAATGKVKQIPWTENRSVIQGLAEDVTCAKEPDNDACVFPNLEKRLEQVDLGRSKDDLDILFAIGGETEALIERAEAIEDSINRKNKLFAVAVLAALVGDAAAAQEALEKSGIDPTDKNFIRQGLPALLGTAYLLAGGATAEPKEALAALDAAKKSQTGFLSVANATRPAVYNLAKWSISEVNAGRTEVAKTTMASLLKIVDINSDDFSDLFGPQVASEVIVALSKVGMTNEAQSILDTLIGQQFYGKRKVSDIGRTLDVATIRIGEVIEWLPDLLSVPEAKSACSKLVNELYDGYADNSGARKYIADALVARVAFACGEKDFAKSTLETSWKDFVLSGEPKGIEIGAYLAGTLFNIQEEDRAKARLEELKGLTTYFDAEMFPYMFVQQLALADAAPLGLEFARSAKKDGTATDLSASSLASVAVRLVSDGNINEAKEAARLATQLLVGATSDENLGQSSQLFNRNTSDVFRIAFPGVQGF